VPFVLYISFNLIDLIDGYAARRWGQPTRLGEKLDLDLDGRGMLVGGVLAVLAGTAGWWYLLVGLARYIYVAAVWVRRRIGLPITEHPNPNSRPLAGLQMGITTALLAPTLHPPFTILISTLTMVPFLANFTYDWLVAIGKAPAVQRPMLPDPVRGAVGLVLRVIVVSLLVFRVATGAGHEPIYVELLIGAGLLLGAGARVLALVLLAWLGLALGSQAPGTVVVAIMLASLALVYTGAGWLALWAPEDAVIRKRLGEER
jgi:phosphatidylglycerophosphate synthase